MLVFLDAPVPTMPEVMISQAAAQVDANTLELTDANTRESIAGQLKAFAACA